MDERLWKVLKESDAWEKDEQTQKAIRESEELEWETVRLWVKCLELFVNLIEAGQNDFVIWAQSENLEDVKSEGVELFQSLIQAERELLALLSYPENFVEDDDRSEGIAWSILTMPKDTVRSLREAAEGAKQALESRSVPGLMLNTMKFCAIMGGWDYQFLRAATQKHRERGAAGGKMNAISDAEKVWQYHAWDRALQAYGKKTMGFQRLKIPKSTYYAYRKVALEKKR